MDWTMRPQAWRRLQLSLLWRLHWRRRGCGRIPVMWTSYLKTSSRIKPRKKALQYLKKSITRNWPLASPTSIWLSFWVPFCHRLILKNSKFGHSVLKPPKSSATALARRRDTSCGNHVWHYRRYYRRLLPSFTIVVLPPSFHHHLLPPFTAICLALPSLLPSFITIVYHRHFTTFVSPSFTTAVYCHRSVTVSVLLSVCWNILKGTPQIRPVDPGAAVLARPWWIKNRCIFEPPFLSWFSRFWLPFGLRFGACFLICASFFRASNSQRFFYWFLMDFWDPWSCEKRF